MIEFINKGMTKLTSAPKYGKQDIGVSPYGAMDTFAVRTANAMLGKVDYYCESYEFMMIPPKIKVLSKIHFIITGGHRETFRNDTVIPHATIVEANEGDVIRFGKCTRGFRTYFTWLPETSLNVGNSRKAFEKFGFVEKNNFIRVVKGAEYDLVTDKDSLFAPWVVGAHDDMGMRLTGNTVEQDKVSMVSSPVADGTIQLNPDGTPTILLKNRQTVGGYPRVLNVISADVDMLAQYQKGNIVRFKLVTMAEAQVINDMRELALRSM